MDFRDANHENFTAEILNFLVLFDCGRVYRGALLEREIYWLWAESLKTLGVCLLQALLVFCNVTNKNPQAHGYRYSFHPRVFQGIVSTEKCEYAIYRFRLIQGHTRRCGENRREDFLYLESMPRRRDHVAVIL